MLLFKMTKTMTVRETGHGGWEPGTMENALHFFSFFSFGCMSMHAILPRIDVPTGRF